MRRAAAALCALTAAAGAASGADCTMAHARYAQPETGYAIEFSPLDPHALAASNVFELLLPNGKGPLAGEVAWGNGEIRPIGYLRHGCAPDEEDIDALEACMHWRGIVYGIADGAVILLPHDDEPAPEQIILANLGQDLRYSLAFSELELDPLPWDVFTFAGCAP